jgi:hypothetical protein
VTQEELKCEEPACINPYRTSNVRYTFTKPDGTKIRVCWDCARVRLKKGEHVG